MTNGIAEIACTDDGLIQVDGREPEPLRGSGVT